MTRERNNFYRMTSDVNDLWVCDKTIFRIGIPTLRKKTNETRTIRKSDYTPALALPKHMACIFDEKCREKEKYREEQIAECPFSIPRHNLSL